MVEIGLIRCQSGGYQAYDVWFDTNSRSEILGDYYFRMPGRFNRSVSIPEICAFIAEKEDVEISVDLRAFERIHLFYNERMAIAPYYMDGKLVEIQVGQKCS